MYNFLYNKDMTQAKATNTRREELQKLSVKTGLRPIAKDLGIKNYSSSIRKNLLIDSILEFERLLPYIEIPLSEINKLQSIIDSNKKRYEELQKLKLEVDFSKLEVDFSKMDGFQIMDEMKNIDENNELRRKYKQNFEEFKNTNTYQKLRRKELEKLTVINGLRPIARSLGIKRFQNINKKQMIDSILEFENGVALFIIEEYYKNKVKHEDSYEYQKIIEIYQNMDILIFRRSNEENEKRKCKICGGIKFEEEDGCIICEDCGLIIEEKFILK